MLAHTKYARTQSVHFGSLTTVFFQRLPYDTVLEGTRLPGIYDVTKAVLSCLSPIRNLNGRSFTVDSWQTGPSNDRIIWQALKKDGGESDTFFQEGPMR